MPGPKGPRTPYPVDDPGLDDQPGADPDFIPGTPLQPGRQRGRVAASDRDRKRREAAAQVLSAAMLPAGSAVAIEADPRLDDDSETEEAIERTADPDKR